MGDFVISETKVRSQHESKNGLWFVDEGSLPSYTVDEVYKGLAANENVLVRTQQLNDEREKTVLSRTAF